MSIEIKRVVACSLVLCLAAYAPSEVHSASGSRLSGKPQVMSGDELQFGKERIRLFGIQAPKALQLCQDEAKRYYQCGIDAQLALKRVINSQFVRCRKTGKISAVCYVGSKDIAQELLTMGLAVPSSPTTREYRATSGQARRLRVGIWRGFFVNPAEWEKAFRSKGIVRTKSTP